MENNGIDTLLFGTLKLYYYSYGAIHFMKLSASSGEQLEYNRQSGSKWIRLKREN